MILNRDANPSVDDWDLKIPILRLLFLDDFNHSLHFAFLGELQGIGLQAQQDLHNPVFIAVDERTEFDEWLSNFFSDIDVVDAEVYILVLGFLLEDAHHFFDAVSDIEFFEVVSKFIAFNLSEVEHVLNYEVHQLSWVLLNYLAFVKFLKDWDAPFECWLLPHFGIEFLK